MSSSDPAAILDEPGARHAYAELADELNRSPAGVVDNARRCLDEMMAEHVPLAEDAWARLGRWLLRAYRIEVNHSAVNRLLDLDAGHSLVWLPSHRSYLDAWMGPTVMEDHGLSIGYTLGGANLNFFPFGTIAKRTGMIFIRRSTQDDPVYRLTLRVYIAHLMAHKANLGWAIEGGRTRTGKLRPPRFGILRYVLDAVESQHGPEVLAVPVSMVYDQLHELNTVTAEARGASKSPEDLRWLLRFARSQSRELGRAYLDFGEPIPLRQRIAELTAARPETSTAVERIALEVCHGINQVTPVTATGIVTLALLAANRALTLDEMLTHIGPLAAYLEARRRPPAGNEDLLDAAVLRRTLGAVVESRVVTRCDSGTETVWSIEPGQHLVAAFYRNAAIHLFVNRSIGELCLVAALEQPGHDLRSIGWEQALALRDLLKFEFFFSAQAEFMDEMRAELSLIAPEWQGGGSPPAPDDMRSWLERGRPHMAPLVLRPFFDAYSVVAERLAARAGDGVDSDALLHECLGVAEQWVLQRRISSEESVSLELFRPALALARHRGLLDPATPDLAVRRRDLADEIATALRRISAIAAFGPLPLAGEGQTVGASSVA